MLEMLHRCTPVHVHTNSTARTGTACDTHKQTRAADVSTCADNHTPTSHTVTCCTQTVYSTTLPTLHRIWLVGGHAAQIHPQTPVGCLLSGLSTHIAGTHATLDLTSCTTEAWCISMRDLANRGSGLTCFSTCTTPHTHHKPPAAHASCTVAAVAAASGSLAAIHKHAQLLYTGWVQHADACCCSLPSHIPAPIIQLPTPDSQQTHAQHNLNTKHPQQPLLLPAHKHSTCAATAAATEAAAAAAASITAVVMWHTHSCAGQP
jgi:hypothetical protein